MIDQKIMYIQKAHRLSLYNLASTVTEVHEGQLFQLNADGEWEYADGTKRAYPSLNNRFSGQGLGPQGERLEGRDDVSRSGKITVLSSGFEIGTDQYDDTVEYTLGAPLAPSADPEQKGKLTLFDTATGQPHLIRGYVTQAPKEAGDFLRYEG